MATPLATLNTFHGRFVELIPYEKIVEVVEFESDAPRFAGEMKITTSFADTDEGTEITVLCEDIPAGIRPEDNEMGCKSSLQKSGLPHRIVCRDRAQR